MFAFYLTVGLGHRLGSLRISRGWNWCTNQNMSRANETIGALWKSPLFWCKNKLFELFCAEKAHWAKRRSFGLTDTIRTKQGSIKCSRWYSENRQLNRCKNRFFEPFFAEKGSLGSKYIKWLNFLAQKPSQKSARLKSSLWKRHCKSRQSLDLSCATIDYLNSFGLKRAY